MIGGTVLDGLFDTYSVDFIVGPTGNIGLGYINPDYKLKVKELKVQKDAEIEELRTKNAELEARINDLEKRLIAGE